MANIHDVAGFLWSIADEVLRDDFKRGKYPDVILPFVMLRRLDCVLELTKQKVLQRAALLKARGITRLRLRGVLKAQVELIPRAEVVQRVVRLAWTASLKSIPDVRAGRRPLSARNG